MKILPIFGAASIKKFYYTYAKLNELIFILDKHELGGVTNSDEEICAICGTT